ncbi:MAG: hypothetical protein IKN55_09770, partial [Oscillospiraceae bacterium]|nr:hypothetical protein [Oscillospiraceae bacterium]
DSRTAGLHPAPALGAVGNYDACCRCDRSSGAAAEYQAHRRFVAQAAYSRGRLGSIALLAGGVASLRSLLTGLAVERDSPVTVWR